MNTTTTTTTRQVRAAKRTNSLPRLIAQKLTVRLLLESLEDADQYGYDVNPEIFETEKGRVKFMIDTFFNEFYHWRTFQQRLKIAELFTDYLQGLPFCSIPFMNYEILELLKAEGIEARNDDEEDEFIKAYWESGGVALLILMRKHKHHFGDLINRKK